MLAKEEPVIKLFYAYSQPMGDTLHSYMYVCLCILNYKHQINILFYL